MPVENNGRIHFAQGKPAQAPEATLRLDLDNELFFRPMSRAYVAAIFMYIGYLVS